MLLISSPRALNPLHFPHLLPPLEIKLMIITIDIIYHSITNFEIKINLYFYVVDKSVYDLMCISLSKPLPVLPHRQILNMQLK